MDGEPGLSSPREDVESRRDVTLIERRPKKPRDRASAYYRRIRRAAPDISITRRGFRVGTINQPGRETRDSARGLRRRRPSDPRGIKFAGPQWGPILLRAFARVYLDDPLAGRLFLNRRPAPLVARALINGRCPSQADFRREVFKGRPGRQGYWEANHFAAGAGIRDSPGPRADLFCTLTK